MGTQPDKATTPASCCEQNVSLVLSSLAMNAYLSLGRNANEETQSRTLTKASNYNPALVNTALDLILDQRVDLANTRKDAFFVFFVSRIAR